MVWELGWEAEGLVNPRLTGKEVKCVGRREDVDSAWQEPERSWDLRRWKAEHIGSCEWEGWEEEALITVGWGTIAGNM